MCGHGSLHADGAPMYSDKDRINFFVAEAKGAFAKEEWRVATTALEKLTQLRDRAIDWAWLGKARERAGWPMLAKSAFQQALSRDSTNQVALEGLRALRYLDSSAAANVGLPSKDEDYVSRCWRCQEVVGSAKSPRCANCGWYICRCGACSCNMPDDVRSRLR